MKKATICFCVKGNEVLLAKKKQGFGSGKWNGYGGKVEGCENPKSAAIRELQEESGLFAEEGAVEHVAIIRFYFDGNPAFECHIFLVRAWRNNPIETEEMGQPQWHPILNLPFYEMWAADALWIPLVLDGKNIEAKIDFNKDGSIVKEFNFKPLELN